MINCPSCRKQIADNAEVCPKCGRINTKEELEKLKEDNIKATKFAFIVLAIAILTLTTCVYLKPNKIEKPQTRTEKIESNFSAWDGSHIKLSRYVKERMKNPDSFEEVSTKYRDNGSKITVQMTYRGTNSFGAIVTNSIIANTDAITGEVLEIIENY